MNEKDKMAGGVRSVLTFRLDRRLVAAGALLVLLAMLVPILRIMEYAVEEGFAASFESEIMQKKLRTLCLGIRQAFDLQDSPEIFPWEQYLKTPLNQK